MKPETHTSRRSAVKRSIRTSICSAAVAAGLITVPASPAYASGLTLSLSAPSPVVVGKPAILTAAGSIPIADLDIPYWFSLDAIPVSVTTRCPTDRWAGYQLATSTGGTGIVLTQREPPDAAGNFMIPVGITPTAPGSVLLCGYTDDGLTNTLAVASLTLNIQAASSSRKPTAAGISADVRTAIRSCRALLAGSALKSCIRDAVSLANRQCRRLRPPSKSSACLTAVRRVRRTA
jgi:hypothetical protein